MNAVFNEFDTQIMTSLLQKASVMKGKTTPNPMTASAIVKKGICIAEGVHQAVGCDHAEIVALKQAGADAIGATLYVNLEPCTHFGKTPPCVAAIIKAGIAEVVYAMDDPNPLVRHSGADHILREAGIRVRKGLLEKEAQQLNEVFIKNITKKLPFVILKAGVSNDGKLTPKKGEGGYITGYESLKDVHRIRREVDGILVGIRTVLIDNPVLNVRYDLLDKKDKAPKKIIFDVYGKCPIEPRLFYEDAQSGVIIFRGIGETHDDNVYPSNVTVIDMPHSSGHFLWEDVLSVLYKHGVYNLLIEGGEGVFKSALDAFIVDKAHIYLAPKTIGGDDTPELFKGHGLQDLAESLQLINMDVSPCGSDQHIIAYRQRI